MRDGQGNKVSPEEQQKVRSIQGAPDQTSLNDVSIDPKADKDTGDADKPLVRPSDRLAAGVGE